jgi:hypothetical protein
MQNVLVDDRRIWVDLYVSQLFIKRVYRSGAFLLAHNLSHGLTTSGQIILIERTGGMPEVAVASAVVMILKPHESTGMMMAGAIEASRMRWYSISGVLRIHPEGTVTGTNGGRASVQGRCRLAKGGSVGAAEAGTWDDKGGQTAIVTVTDFVTGGANGSPSNP